MMSMSAPFATIATAPTAVAEDWDNYKSGTLKCNILVILMSMSAPVATIAAAMAIPKVKDWWHNHQVKFK